MGLSSLVSVFTVLNLVLQNPLRRLDPARSIRVAHSLLLMGLLLCPHGASDLPFALPRTSPTSLSTGQLLFRSRFVTTGLWPRTPHAPI